MASGGLDNMCTVYNLKTPVIKTVKELDAHSGKVYKSFENLYFILSSVYYVIVSLSIFYRLLVLLPLPQ